MRPISEAEDTFEINILPILMISGLLLSLLAWRIFWITE